MSGDKDKIKSEIEQVKKEVKEEVDKVKAEVKAEVDKVKSEIKRYWPFSGERPQWAKDLDEKSFREPATRFAGYGLASVTALPVGFKKTKSLMGLSTLLFVGGDIYFRTKDVSDTSEKVCHAFDTILWQGLATITFPIFAAQGLKHLAAHLTTHPIHPKCKDPSHRLDGMALTLLSLPILSIPIDKASSLILDNAVRPFLSCTKGGGEKEEEKK